MIHNKEIICPYCALEFKARTNYVDKKFNEQSSHQVSVEKFMKLGGQEVPSKPTIPSLDVRQLRAKLILEEAIETVHGLGFEIEFFNQDSYLLHECDEPSLVDIIDGCCDLRVITTGTLSACGVKDIVPQELVDSNNLEKFKWTSVEAIGYCLDHEDCKWTRIFINEENFILVKNSSGKIIKPPSHKPPAIDQEIERQMKLDL